MAAPHPALARAGAGDLTVQAGAVLTHCDVCSAVSDHDPDDGRPDWAVLGAFTDCVEWPDPSEPPRDHLPFGVRRAPPEPGGDHEALVSFPFFARANRPFWTLFQRTDDRPGTLVRCQIIDELGPYAGEWPDGWAHRPELRLRLRVVDSIPVAALLARPPADAAALSDLIGDLIADDHGTGHVSRFDLYTDFCFDVEGDVGWDLFCAGRALVLYHPWSMCRDGDLYAGHVPIPPEVWAELERRCARGDD